MSIGQIIKVSFIMIAFVYPKMVYSESSTYFSTSWYEGSDNFKIAQKIAETNHAKLLLYFYTDWCRYCRKFETELLSKETISSSLRDIVKIKMNPEKDEGANNLMNLFHRKGYPTVLIKDSESEQFSPIYPFSRTNGSWKLQPDEQFIAEVHSSNR